MIIKLIDTVFAILSIACALIGLCLGAATGWASGGWIGAIALGVIGAAIGASLPLMLRSGAVI
jgi:hypothetical protein